MIWDFAVIAPRFLYGLGILYTGLSAAALLAYAFDKWAAIKGWRRVRENILHLVALLGGWPGAYAGQRLFRHKTRKQSFRRVFYMAVIANSAILLWLMSSSGQTFLNGF